MPKHNADYWIPKFERNVERDIEKRAQLEAAGWIVITVWECEMKDMDDVMKRVICVLKDTDRCQRGVSSNFRRRMIQSILERSYLYLLDSGSRTEYDLIRP